MDGGHEQRRHLHRRADDREQPKLAVEHRGLTPQFGRPDFQPRLRLQQMDIRRAEAECREHKRQQADYQSSARFHGPRTEPRAREFQIVLGAYRTGQASWGRLSSPPPLLSPRLRPEERRVGKEGVSTGKYRWW